MFAYPGPGNYEGVSRMVDMEDIIKIGDFVDFRDGGNWSSHKAIAAATPCYDHNLYLVIDIKDDTEKLVHPDNVRKSEFTRDDILASDPRQSEVVAYNPLDKAAEFEYKCRRCGGIYRNPGCSYLMGERILMEISAIGRRTDPEKGGHVGKLSTHQCEDGGQGLADLIGFRMV